MLDTTKQSWGYFFSCCFSTPITRSTCMQTRDNSRFQSISTFSKCISVIFIVNILVLIVLFFYKFNEDVCVEFPVYMYSYEKFVRLSSGFADFSECLTVNLVKLNIIINIIIIHTI